MLPPKGHLAMSRDIFHCHNCSGSVLLASSRQRPGMLLNILKYTTQFSTTKIITWPQMSTMLQVRNLDLKKDPLMEEERWVFMDNQESQPSSTPSALTPARYLQAVATAILESQLISKLNPVCPLLPTYLSPVIGSELCPK